MRIPKLERNAQYRVTVPALNGGVNRKDAPNLVGDNQLTDVQNMWWRDQALRTRPGMYTDGAHTQLLVSSDQTPQADWQYVPNNVRMRIEDQETECQAYLTYNEGSRPSGSLLLFFIDRHGDVVSRTSVDLLPAEDPLGDLAQSAVLFNGTKAGSLHVLLDNGDIVTLTHDGESGWKQERNEEPYIPTVVVNGVGVPDYFTEPSSSVTGTLFESYNLLGSKFRSLFTTDGKGAFFYLPQKGLDDTEIKITLTNSDGTVNHYTIEAGKNLSTPGGDDNAGDICALVDREEGKVGFLRGDLYSITMPFVGRNSNLEVIASKTDKDARRRICSMTRAIWFGGSQSGLSNGTRVFVAGNPDSPHLLHWSDANNPLYFPENNYTYVGDPNGAITALHKQADMLVIFKEWELYYTQYQAGVSFKVDDIVEGRIVDVAAYSATFPLAPIHAEIGCDCPDTISLCHNRLVWGNSRGKVYTLVSANIYSTANVRELSAYIEPWLTQHDRQTWKSAHACTFSHWYCLVVADQAYLLDYDVTGFTSYSSYSSADAAQKALAWYRWQFPGDGGMTFIPFSVEDALVLAGIRHYGTTGADGERNAVYLHICLLQGENDTHIQQTGTVFDVDTIRFEPCVVTGMFQSKLFDFGQPERRKNIRRLHIGATDAAPGYLTLSYITETGTHEDVLRLGAYGSGTMQEWCVTPSVSRARQFGIRAESEGGVVVDGIVLRYEFNGEVR